MAARSGVRSLSASALNEQRPSANGAAHGRSLYASTRKLPPPRARNRYSNQHQQPPHAADSSSGYEYRGDQLMPLPRTQGYTSHAHAARRGVQGSQEYNSGNTILVGIGENNDIGDRYNQHNNECDEYYINQDDDRCGDNSEYDSAHDQRCSRSQHGYSDDGSDYDSEYSTSSYSDYSTQSAAPALPQFSSSGVFRAVDDESQKARRGSTSSAPLPARSNCKSSSRGAHSKILTSSLTSGAVTVPRRAHTRDSVGPDRTVSSSTSSSAKELTPALRALLAVNFLCDPSVYDCLRSLNVRTVDQLSAYSAQDFAGQRGKLNMIQARKLEAMCQSYQARNCNISDNSNKPIDNLMTTPVAVTTSNSMKAARSSPDSVLDFMGTPPLPEEEEMSGASGRISFNSADSWAPVQPGPDRRRVGSAHSGIGLGSSSNLLSSSIGPGLVPLAKQEESFPSRAERQLSAPLYQAQVPQPNPSTSSFARPRACRRSGTSLDQVTGFNIGNSNNHNSSRICHDENGSSSDTGGSVNNRQECRVNRRPTAWELRTGGPPSPSRFVVPAPAAPLPQPPPPPPLIPLLPPEPLATKDSFEHAGSDFEAIMREQLQEAAGEKLDHHSHLNSISSGSNNGKNHRKSKAKPLPKGIDALAARLRQAAESSSDNSGSDSNSSDNSSSSSSSDEADDDEDEFGSFSLDLDRRRERMNRRRMPSRRKPSRRKPSRRRAPQRTFQGADSSTSSQLYGSNSNDDDDDDLAVESEPSLLSIETLSPVRNRQNRSNHRRQNRRQRPKAATNTGSDSGVDSPSEEKSSSSNLASRRSDSVDSIDVAGSDDQPTRGVSGVAPKKSLLSSSSQMTSHSKAPQASAPAASSSSSSSASSSASSSSYIPSWPRMPRSSLFSTSTSKQEPAATKPPVPASSTPAETSQKNSKGLPVVENVTKKGTAKTSKGYLSSLFGFSSTCSKENAPSPLSAVTSTDAAAEGSDSKSSHTAREGPSTPEPHPIRQRKRVAGNSQQQPSSLSIASRSGGASSCELLQGRRRNQSDDSSINDSINSKSNASEPTVCEISEVDESASVEEDEIVLGFLDRLKKLNDSYDLLPAPFSAGEVAMKMASSSTGAAMKSDSAGASSSVSAATTEATSGVSKSTEDPFLSRPRLLNQSSGTCTNHHDVAQQDLANTSSTSHSMIPNAVNLKGSAALPASTTSYMPDKFVVEFHGSVNAKPADSTSSEAPPTTDNTNEWTPHLDPNSSGHYYWYNNTTGESKWEHQGVSVEDQHEGAIVSKSGHDDGDGNVDDFPPTPEWKSTREDCAKDESSVVVDEIKRVKTEDEEDEDRVRPLTSGARRHSWGGESPLRSTTRTRRGSNSFNHSNSSNTTFSSTTSNSRVAGGDIISVTGTASGSEESRGFETHNDGGGRRKDSRKALRSANEEWRARMAAKKKGGGGGGGGRKEAPTGDFIPLQES